MPFNFVLSEGNIKPAKAVVDAGRSNSIFSTALVTKFLLSRVIEIPVAVTDLAAASITSLTFVTLVLSAVI